MTVADRAFSLFEIKQIDEERRIIEGIATHPKVDRVGDIIEMDGLEFAEKVPLLLYHDNKLPVGQVRFGKPTKNGLPFVAQLPKVSEPGRIKDRVDEAWHSVKYRLIEAVSIGFKPIDDAIEHIETGFRFLKTLILELSLVPVPAQDQAVITGFKSMDADAFDALKKFDTEAKAASGQQSAGADATPGVSGKSNKPVSLRQKDAKTMSKTIDEQIAALESKRAANAARMEEIMKSAMDEDRTTEDEEQEEFDGLDSENKRIDADLKRFKALRESNMATAKEVNGKSTDDASASRTVGAVVKIRSKELPKGTRFARYVQALAAARGNRFEAAEIAKRWKDSTPEIEQILRMPSDLVEKTAVAAGTTTDSTWAEPLVQLENMTSEFIEYLRPLTIMGRIDGFRRVPFNIKVPRQTAGASVNWVGETKVKPLTSLAFDQVTLDHKKIAGIIPMSEELVRFSNPSAEELVRSDLAAAITQFMDVEFIDPSNASTDVSPASVTYGVTPITSTGTTAAAFRANVKSMFDAMLTANQQVSMGYWVMTQSQALAFSLMLNALGQPEFPNIAMNGGTLLGFPVVTSQNIPATTGSPADGYPIVFVMPGEILLADDGGVNIDMSREASLQMETTPDSPVTASTVMVNLWQHNMIALKAERFVNWKVRRSTACGIIAGAKYAE